MKFGSKLKVLSLTLCALMIVSVFSVTVFADTTPTLTAQTPSATVVTGTHLKQVTVPFTCANVAQVTLLVVKAAKDATTAPDALETNIVYIDQMAAPAGGTGSFTFKVDMDTLGDLTHLFIKLGGTSLDNPALTVIEVGTSLQLGDLNGDSKIDIDDTLEHLKVVLGKPSTTLVPSAVTDYDHNSTTDIDDTLIHLKVVLGKQTF